MSFWGFIVLLTLVGIMVGALYLAKRAANKELEMQTRRNRIRQIRSEIVDIDEIVRTLLLYDRNPELLFSIVDRMENDISEGLSLIPNSPDLLSEKESLTKIRSQINVLVENPQEPEIPATDRQIFLVKRHFSQSMKLIRELYQKGEIDDISFRIHRSRLMLNSLLLEYKAYVQQAEDSKKKHELSMAANFYKHAKEILTKSELNFPTKTEEIKRMSRAISGLYITHSEDEVDPPST